jgi:hypothetical protein
VNSRQGDLGKRAIALRDDLFGTLTETYNHSTSSSDLPRRLYHFTDTDGLLAIIKNRSLRGTLATALSDTSELKAGVQQTEAVIQQRRRHRQRDFFDDMMLKLLKPKAFNAVLEVPVRVFVMSFCADPTLSVHWTHYGKSGTGCALGFATSKLSVLGLSLVKVRYSIQAQRALVENLLSAARRVVAKALEALSSDEDKRRFVGIAAHMTVAFIRTSSTVFKNEAFQHEDEWRLTFQLVLGRRRRLPRGYKFKNDYRSVNGRLCPFGEISYPKARFPLETIVLGRASAMSEDDEGIRLLLEDSLGAKAAAKIVVMRSGVPIRP